MKKYIFITPEGNTFSPNGEEVENMQVIGIVEDVTNEETYIREQIAFWTKKLEAVLEKDEA